VIRDAAETTIVGLWKGCCGWFGQVRHGAICRTNSANGTPSTRASDGGGKRTCGSGFSSTCPRIQISDTSASMRRWSGSIRMAPAQKGDSKSGHRQISRRPDDEDRGDRRCARQSDPLRALAGPAARHHQLRRLALIGDKGFDAGWLRERLRANVTVIYSATSRTSETSCLNQHWLSSIVAQLPAWWVNRCCQFRAVTSSAKAGSLGLLLGKPQNFRSWRVRALRA
jgi:hypothetical protein